MESLYSNADKMVAFAALVILAPIAEELIFRGYLYGKLRTRLSAIPAIILVSVLFGFMHGQWNVGIVVGVMSIFLCIARELTGTIYAGVLMHMIRNGLAFYLLYINPISAVGVLGVALPVFLL
jgi:membrane protease YdiL (CAAX protease family)